MRRQWAVLDGRLDYFRRYFSLNLSRRRVCGLLRSIFRPSMLAASTCVGKSSGWRFACRKAFTGRFGISGSTHVVILDSLPYRQNRRCGEGDNRTIANRFSRKPAAMKTSHVKKLTLGAVPVFFLSLT